MVLANLAQRENIRCITARSAVSILLFALYCIFSCSADYSTLPSRNCARRPSCAGLFGGQRVNVSVPDVSPSGTVPPEVPVVLDGSSRAELTPIRVRHACTIQPLLRPYCASHDAPQRTFLLRRNLRASQERHNGLTVHACITANSHATAYT